LSFGEPASFCQSTVQSNSGIRADEQFSGRAGTAAVLVGDQFVLLTTPHAARVDNLGKYTDVYNAAGQGIRIERGTNEFVTFLEGSKPKP
jgi:hypothetical protein